MIPSGMAESGRKQSIPTASIVKAAGAQKPSFSVRRACTRKTDFCYSKFCCLLQQKWRGSPKMILTELTFLPKWLPMGTVV